MSEKEDPIVALRETAECLLITQRELSGDVADMAAAVTALTESSEALTRALGTVDELKRAVEQLGEAMLEYPKKLGELFDAHRELVSQVGRYVTDHSKQESGIRQVDARVKLLEAQLALRPTGG